MATEEVPELETNPWLALAPKYQNHLRIEKEEPTDPKPLPYYIDPFCLQLVMMIAQKKRQTLT